MLLLPDGFEPIPGGMHGGGRKAKAGGGFEYWYPSASLATAAAAHHRAAATREPHRAAEHHEHAAGADADAAASSEYAYGDLHALHAHHKELGQHIAGSPARLAAAKATYDAAVRAAKAAFLEVHNHEARLQEAATDAHDALWSDSQEAVDDPESGLTEVGSGHTMSPDMWEESNPDDIEPEDSVSAAETFAATHAAAPVPPVPMRKAARGRLVRNDVLALYSRFAELAKGKHRYTSDPEVAKGPGWEPVKKPRKGQASWRKPNNPHGAEYQRLRNLRANHRKLAAQLRTHAKDLAAYRVVPPNGMLARTAADQAHQASWKHRDRAAELDKVLANHPGRPGAEVHVEPTKPREKKPRSKARSTPNPDQPRTQTDPTALSTLASAIHDSVQETPGPVHEDVHRARVAQRLNRSVSREDFGAAAQDLGGRVKRYTTGRGHPKIRMAKATSDSVPMSEGGAVPDHEELHRRMFHHNAIAGALRVQATHAQSRASLLPHGPERKTLRGQVRDLRSHASRHELLGQEYQRSASTVRRSGVHPPYMARLDAMHHEIHAHPLTQGVMQNLLRKGTRPSKAIDVPALYERFVAAGAR